MFPVARGAKGHPPIPPSDVQHGDAGVGSSQCTRVTGVARVVHVHPQWHFYSVADRGDRLCTSRGTATPIVSAIANSSIPARPCVATSTSRDARPHPRRGIRTTPRGHAHRQSSGPGARCDGLDRGDRLGGWSSPGSSARTCR